MSGTNEKRREPGAGEQLAAAARRIEGAAEDLSLSGEGLREEWTDEAGRAFLRSLKMRETHLGRLAADLRKLAEITEVGREDS